MKMLLFYVVAICGMGISTNAFSQAIAEKNAPKTIAPGVTWQHKTAEGPLNFNILRVRIDHPAITLEIESGQDRLYVGEKVRDSAIREAEPGNTEIVGAVNADFWMYTPIPFNPVGLLVADGMIYNMPSKNRSAFVFTEDETPYLGLVTLNVTLKTGDNRLKIDRINSNTRSDHEIVLFTPPYGSEVGPAKGKRFRLQMQGQEFLPNKPLNVSVTEIDSNSSSPLSADSMILFIPAEKVETLDSPIQPGNGVLYAELPQVSGIVQSVCGGGPLIVTDGEIDVQGENETNHGKSFRDSRHPRTAIGFSKDKKTIYLLTIDGRQPELSVGATLKELAQYMVDLGCWRAMNLDGGGSTSMVVGNKYVNKPSDLGGPRTVANSLLVVRSLDDATSATTAAN